MSAVKYEYRYESDTLFTLRTGKSHPGIRVTYRRVGERNYKRFLVATNTPPDEFPQDVIITMIRAHEARYR